MSKFHMFDDSLEESYQSSPRSNARDFRAIVYDHCFALFWLLSCRDVFVERLLDPFHSITIGEGVSFGDLLRSFGAQIFLSLFIRLNLFCQPLQGEKFFFSQLLHFSSNIGNSDLLNPCQSTAECVDNISELSAKIFEIFRN